MASVATNLIDLEELKPSDACEKDDQFQFYESVKKHFPLEELYNIGLQFCKEKYLIARSVNDDTRTQLLGYTKKFSNGSFKGGVESTEVGMLEDKDGNSFWESLKDMSREEVMVSFTDLLSTHCPAFNTHLRTRAQQMSNSSEASPENGVRMWEPADEEARKQEIMFREKIKLRQESIRKEMKEHLDRQTIGHFRQYAKQQCPDDAQEQEEMMQELQRQHFEQYYEEVYLQQLAHQRQQYYQLQLLAQQAIVEPSTNDQQMLQNPNIQMYIHQIPQTNDIQSYNDKCDESHKVNDSNTNNSINSYNRHDTNNNTYNRHEDNIMHNSNKNENNSINDILLSNKMNIRDDLKIINETDHGNFLACNHADDKHSNDESDDDDEEYDDEFDKISERMPVLVPACIWTGNDMEAFKNTHRHCPNNLLKVASLCTATIKIPTHEDCALISWTFATDFYDLGFGVFFEWNVNPPDQVIVQVNDSSDEEDCEDEEKDGEREDVEKGDTTLKHHGPPMDEIIQIIRRDSHQELQCGSHCFPGRGVYHFKFDNSFSLWRSKTVYYRISYCK